MEMQRFKNSQDTLGRKKKTKKKKRKKGLWNFSTDH